MMMINQMEYAIFSLYYLQEFDTDLLSTCPLTHLYSPAPSVWNGQCVVDSRHRVLPSYLGVANDRTPENCLLLCMEKKYKFAGVQNGNECWCGNSAPKSTTSGAECNYRCFPDTSQTCGGAWRMNVYSTGRHVFSENHFKRDAGNPICYKLGETTLIISSACDKTAASYLH